MKTARIPEFSDAIGPVWVVLVADHRGAKRYEEQKFGARSRIAPGIFQLPVIATLPGDAAVVFILVLFVETLQVRGKERPRKHQTRRRKCHCGKVEGY